MSSSQSLHSLAFRVMRLCRPTFHAETPLRFNLSDLIVGEDLHDDPQLRRLLQSPTTTDLTYTNRFLLHDDDPSDPMGLSGMLVLPQSFGAIYLGETFCSYISINNSSSFEVRDIIIKAEIQTERQRILLLDTTKTPVETIRAGGRHDFIVEHDVKELGAHTEIFRPPILIKSGGGIHNYLYHLKSLLDGSAPTKFEGSNVLGKLQIT